MTGIFDEEYFNLVLCIIEMEKMLIIVFLEKYLARMETGKPRWLHCYFQLWQIAVVYVCVSVACLASVAAATISSVLLPIPPRVVGFIL